MCDYERVINFRITIYFISWNYWQICDALYLDNLTDNEFAQSRRF